MLRFAPVVLPWAVPRAGLGIPLVAWLRVLGALGSSAMVGLLSKIESCVAFPSPPSALPSAALDANGPPKDYRLALLTWVLAIAFCAPDAWPCPIRVAGEARGLAKLLENFPILVRSGASDFCFRVSVPGLTNGRVNGALVSSCVVGRLLISDYNFSPCDGGRGLAGTPSPKSGA